MQRLTKRFNTFAVVNNYRQGRMDLENYSFPWIIPSLAQSEVGNSNALGIGSLRVKRLKDFPLFL